MKRGARAAAAALMLIGTASAAEDNPYMPVSGNAHFSSALQAERVPGAPVRDFLMQRHPVTNAEFLAFVRSHPEWQRGVAPPLFADAGYLDHWQSSAELGAQAAPQQPVTRISWFAAQAYCESQHARLPSWQEWELAAAADETRRDARSDPAWRQRILDWYARPAGKDLAAVGQTAPNVYGLVDLHGLVWEWVQDAGALMSSDEAQKFCGSSSMTLQQKEHYAVLMRVAMLSSLRPSDTGHVLGFRCARDMPEPGQ